MLCCGTEYTQLSKNCSSIRRHFRHSPVHSLFLPSIGIATPSASQFHRVCFLGHQIPSAVLKRQSIRVNSLCGIGHHSTTVDSISARVLDQNTSTTPTHHGLSDYSHQIRRYGLFRSFDGMSRVNFWISFNLNAHCLTECLLHDNTPLYRYFSKLVNSNTSTYPQGLSYSAANITVPSLELLPTSVNASRCLNEVRRLNRKHALRLTNIANGCILLSYFLSPIHRKHPYLIWMTLTSTLGSYGVDYWFHRTLGLKGWILTVVQDTKLFCLLRKASPKKDEDLVVVEAEEGVNGESVQREMEQERRLQNTRAWFSGVALAMGIVGLWGDRF